MDQLDQLNAHWDKLKGAEKLLGQTKTILDDLVKMGDTITSEDVVEGAGKLVAAGLDPKSMAGLLATMPEKGEALAGWLSGYAADVTGRLEQLGQVKRQLDYQLGTTALKSLMGEPAPQMALPSPTPEPPAGDASQNPLLPTGV